MIDHVLGRPSTRFRKYQVFTVVLLWSIYLYQGDKHGPKPFRHISEYFTKRLTTWRTLVLFCLSLYVSRNFARVVGLESPEPLANLYSRSYFRATWVTTALDAGFWTAMHLRPKWFKDFASVIFSLYYLVCAEQADEMVRRVRGALTLQHLRVSWNKPNTPYIAAFTSLMRPRKLRVQPRKIQIERPEGSEYEEKMVAWIYYAKPWSELAHEAKLVLDIPGGGFVAMDPRCHDDKLMAWAAKLQIPVVALDYKKAPEKPYPYALFECYDTYYQIVATCGSCIGLSGTTRPKIVVSGDSAGGNLATGLTSLIISGGPNGGWFGVQDDEERLPVPEALVLIYPALNMNMSNWMTEEQMALIKAQDKRIAHKRVIRRKSGDYHRLTSTPYASDGEEEDDYQQDQTTFKHSKKSMRNLSAPGKSQSLNSSRTMSTPAKSSVQHTRLNMTSIISYFNDRILSPEMLRAMIILYIAPGSLPDFATDHLLSPILTPERYLVEFPKTYFMTGECDPLNDDTVIFAGRLRQAHRQRFKERQELGILAASDRFDDTRHVVEMLIPEISHGFLQFVGVFPEGRKYIDQCGRWMRQAFRDAELREVETPLAERRTKDYFAAPGARHHRRQGTSGSEADERPLEISKLSMTPITGGKGKEAREKEKRRQESGRGGIRKRAGSGSGARSPITTRRSLVQLATEELMGRRMNGLTGALLSGGESGPGRN